MINDTYLVTICVGLRALTNDSFLEEMMRDPEPGKDLDRAGRHENSSTLICRSGLFIAQIKRVAHACHLLLRSG